MSNLDEYETKLLLDLAGVTQEDVHWGAAMSVAIPCLVSQGFTTNFPKVEITQKGREYLVSKGYLSD